MGDGAADTVPLSDSPPLTIEGEEVRFTVDGDRAARAALATYARLTTDDELAATIRERFDIDRTPQQVWEEHNAGVQYDPPALPAEQWSSDQYQELRDIHITRRVEWFCTECSGRGPIRSLRAARSHVSNAHIKDLVRKYETPREERDVAADSDEEGKTVDERRAENRGLDEFCEVSDE